MAPKAHLFAIERSRRRGTRSTLLVAKRVAQLPRTHLGSGGVVEWLMAPVLKTGRAQALVGSNPTPSATQFSIFDLRLSICNGFHRTTQNAATIPINAAATTSER